MRSEPPSGAGAPRVLVAIPAFNEEDSIGAVVESVRALGYPACVVNDSSRDHTAEYARAAGATVLDLPVNLGVGGALRCAFQFAVRQGYDVVVQVDGDGQHDPSAIAGLLATMDATGADMVVGSRFLGSDSIDGLSAGRRLAMQILARSASAALGSRITDASSGFRAIRWPLLGVFAQDYPAEYLGDTFEAIVIAALRGATVVEHPVRSIPRQYGTPSAGTLASIWYVGRVLTAAGLIHYRAKHDQIADRRRQRPEVRVQP